LGGTSYGVLDVFDKVIGLERLKVIHVNDSKNNRGSRKDRHKNIGHGYISLQALDYIVHHPQLTKLLETPSIGKIKYKMLHISMKLRYLKEK
jgi:deoxyribonuclease IV